MFSEENSKRELHGHGGEQSLTLDGRAVPAPGADHHKPQLALPAPESEGDASQRQENEPRVLEVGGESLKIDKLGPLIVNTDGVRSALGLPLRPSKELTMPSPPQTLSRITNWQELTPGEQERMVRLVVKKRNKCGCCSSLPRRGRKLTISLGTPLRGGA